ncbi:hypothetical protein EDB19DRAFT_1226452 [Suillus lakei]|nr:hypothetical protein EDB19DRAFT_1226452 [Suillus lakei]
MRFSFLLAVVAALTTSMSVSASDYACTILNGFCGKENGKRCCEPLQCKPGVSTSLRFASAIQHRDSRLAPCTNSHTAM